MARYVIEGPGGTSTLTTGTPETDRAFKMALNTPEALHWVLHDPSSPQSSLAKSWLKQNYGTENLNKIRRMLAKTQRPKKTWQENPLAYAIVIITLTVSGSLLTKYLGEVIPHPTPSVTVSKIPGENPQEAVNSITALPPETIETESKLRRFLHLPKWVRLPFKRSGKSEDLAE